MSAITYQFSNLPENINTNEFTKIYHITKISLLLY